MNFRAKAESIASELGQSNGVPRVVAIDPATVSIVLAILKQAFVLLRWWKPEWFVNWQVSRLIDRETEGTHLQHKTDELHALVLQSLKES